MKKRILVIPDVHGRTFWKEPVCKLIESVDKVIFLGDYLDPYGDFVQEDICQNLIIGRNITISLKETRTCSNWYTWKW